MLIDEDIDRIKKLINVLIKVSEAIVPHPLYIYKTIDYMLLVAQTFNEVNK